MRRKISNTIDDALYQQVRRLAQREDRQINEIIETSLREYLARQNDRTSVVQESRGTYKVSLETVRLILEEDLYDAE